MEHEDALTIANKLEFCFRFRWEIRQTVDEHTRKAAHRNSWEANLLIRWAK